MESLAGASVRKWENNFDWIEITPEEFYLNPRETLRHLYQVFLSKWYEEV